MRPLDLALRLVGTREVPGAVDHPMIQWAHSLAGLGLEQPDETAWCSSFMNLVAFLTGYERTRKASARSWLDIGTPVELEDAIPGRDVVVFWRGDPQGWQGHVALYLARVGDSVHVVGGNQRDAVSVAPYPLERLLGVRRLSLAG